ncbi:hypothetical protein APUTEX25_002558 [Auxenochlorella protothecoides]|uniref:Cas1p 10 TM acyl transferase domain-containing protein n=2 Tax=Auxenochlorella protothecoides TaxID=3075 RepID=A0A3M7KTW9_AUXPR|nr:hypothetical protein APUTEX25_002558 [Auxenochlorella protothecoides]|eukprot:RMZ53981.1 hypothetical protein APUTEX25_002558 [Auxenochlorella protothecoides]
MELLPVTASLDPSAEVPAAHLNGMHAPCSPRPPLSAAALVAPGGALSWAAIRGSGLARCVLLDRAALVSALPTLRAAVEGGAWIMWFFLADRTALLNSTGRIYSRDTFLFMFLALATCAALASQRPTGRPPAVLNRGQTEEWKGWMQVLFLLYHYYSAKEVYNAIRVFIAAYVWMTGYGNFAYYYKTSDFGMGRFCQMMWRLNALVVVCCLALNNSYMLYYICPMHTLFTVFVYAALGLGHAHNKRPGVIWAKLAACLVLTHLLWMNRSVFDLVWRPLRPLLAYTNPARPEGDPMHEWFFRTGLDRYVWVHGMACAALLPRWEAALAALAALGCKARRGARAAVLAVCALVGYTWYAHVFSKPKLEYNALHPYTSWIPITASHEAHSTPLFPPPQNRIVFIVVRNLTPGLRSANLVLFGWLGAVTLETYIGQFHTWLLTRRPDGQPVLLLDLLPGYPLLNFGMATGVYILVSHRLHTTTLTLRDALVPHDDDARLLRNAVMGLALAGGLYAVTVAGVGLAAALAR